MLILINPRYKSHLKTFCNDEMEREEIRYEENVNVKIMHKRWGVNGSRKQSLLKMQLKHEQLFMF